MNFCSQLLELYVIMYVSSLRVLTYTCTHDYPTLLSVRKELMLFYHVSGNVLILELNLQW
jgi:hypothetical protein